MMKFVQIRGCMGSGKTTIVRQFMERRNFEVEFIEVFNKQYPYSIDKSRNIIVTGRYDNRICGGVDGIIKNKDILREYLIKLLKLNPSVMIFEAVMYGITFKFSYELNNICKMFGRDYVAIVPIAPFETAISRISDRNGGKPIKVEAVEKQYTRCLQSSEKLRQNGVNVVFSNTETVPKDEMYKFLEAVL